MANYQLSPDQARQIRMRSQRLASKAVDSRITVPGVVSHACGLQAQYEDAAVLGVRVRSVGLAADDVERARLQERSIVRTWAMRGTLHLIATKDLGWLLALFGPVLIAGSRRRYQELGLDEAISTAGLRVIRETLADRGPLTRQALIEQLAKHNLPATGQAPVHLIGRGALEGWLCLGPDQNGKETYVLVEDWVKPGSINPPVSKDKAFVEIARRYFAAYAPATLADLAAWSGLAMRDLRRGWEAVSGELVEVTLGGQPAWLLEEQFALLDEPYAAIPLVHLLPKYDNYLLGYARRELVVAPEHAWRIHPGGGLYYPVLLVDGRAMGTWRSEKKGGVLQVIVEPFVVLDDAIAPGITAEVKDLWRFLRIATELVIQSV